MIKKEFAQLVKSHRESMHLSQQELAEKSSFSRGTIMHIENANQNVSLEQALVLAAILNIDITKLKTEIDEQLPLFEP